MIVGLSKVCGGGGGGRLPPYVFTTGHTHNLHLLCHVMYVLCSDWSSPAPHTTSTSTSTEHVREGQTEQPHSIPTNNGSSNHWHRSGSLSHSPSTPTSAHTIHASLPRHYSLSSISQSPHTRHSTSPTEVQYQPQGDRHHKRHQTAGPLSSGYSSSSLQNGYQPAGASARGRDNLRHSTTGYYDSPNRILPNTATTQPQAGKAPPLQPKGITHVSDSKFGSVPNFRIMHEDIASTVGGSQPDYVVGGSQDYERYSVDQSDNISEHSEHSTSSSSQVSGRSEPIYHRQK